MIVLACARLCKIEQFIVQRKPSYSFEGVNFCPCSTVKLKSKFFGNFFAIFYKFSTFKKCMYWKLQNASVWANTIMLMIGSNMFSYMMVLWEAWLPWFSQSTRVRLCCWTQCSGAYSPPVVLWFVIGWYPNSRLPWTNSRPTHNLAGESTTKWSPATQMDPCAWSTCCVVISNP